jgi:cytochrome P450
VHLSDPDNYEKIYHVGSKYPKEGTYYGAMSCGDSSFTTLGNEEHRKKRSRLNPFFSKKKILELEDVIQLYASKLCDMAAGKFERGEQLDLHHGFRAVSVDVITDYALNKSYNLLDSPDLGEDFANMWDGLGPTMWIFQQWPPMMTLANSMPEWMASATSSALKSMFQIQAVGDAVRTTVASILTTSQHCRRAIATVRADMASGKTTKARETIFHDLLTPDSTWVVPSDQTLQDEAFAILGAAADTTGHAMNFATIEVVSDPAKYKRLHAELKEAFPDPNAKLDYLTLEKLPYLVSATVPDNV